MPHLQRTLDALAVGGRQSCGGGGVHAGQFSVQRFQPAVGLNTLVGENSLNLVASGTATGAAPAITNLHTMKPRLDVLVTTASTTAIAALRPNGGSIRPVRVGRDANAPGGFLARFVWAPATGVSNASHRAFCGLDGTTNVPTDVENSGLTTGIVGMGWDAADANIQIMHNSGSGAATTPGSRRRWQSPSGAPFAWRTCARRSRPSRSRQA